MRASRSAGRIHAPGAGSAPEGASKVHPVSPRQRQVLELVRERYGSSMPAEPQAYRAIANAIGWKEYGSVKDCLFALRAKGVVRSVGDSAAYPERWEVVR